MNKKYGFTLSCKSFRSLLLRALHTQSQRKTFANQVSFAPLSHTYGFTFAEVMITLVIVGVVSMLVVPNLLDSSNQKVNLAAAKKAKYEIAQAALAVQSEPGCIRWRNCSPSVHQLIANNYLRNTNEIRYRIQERVNNATEIHVLADIDGDGSTDIEYRIVNDGTIKNKNPDNNGNPDLTCTVEHYENESNDNCTAFNSDGYIDARQ